MWVIECTGVTGAVKNTNQARRSCTEPYENRGVPIDGAFIDRYGRKRSRTPYIWDAKIFHTRKGADYALERAQRGHYGTLESGYVLTGVVPDGDYLVKRA